MYRIVIQLAVAKTAVPKLTFLRQWAKKALQLKVEAAAITIRIVEVTEMEDLNLSYRHKQGPTNILSFPFQPYLPEKSKTPLLGDLVICADVVNKEATAQGKSREAHWAHLIVHGVLHLFGYDHVNKKDAQVMEALEIDLLHKFGFENPYIRRD